MAKKDNSAVILAVPSFIPFGAWPLGHGHLPISTCLYYAPSSSLSCLDCPFHLTLFGYAAPSSIIKKPCRTFLITYVLAHRSCLVPRATGAPARQQTFACIVPSTLDASVLQYCLLLSGLLFPVSIPPPLRQTCFDSRSSRTWMIGLGSFMKYVIVQQDGTCLTLCTMARTVDVIVACPVVPSPVL